MNCAGPDYYTPGAIHYSADHSCIGGITGQNESIPDILYTEYDTLYKTERIPQEELGSFQYESPVPNGNYVVLLHFAEIWFGAPGGPSNSNVPGKRVFSVDIENQRRLSDYDIIADVGTMAAAVKRYDVAVCDGSLSLSFTASVNKPKCSAIEILPAPTPYSGVAQLPGRVEAEHFDKGGEGSAFHDGWSYNQGDVYRTSEGVDIRTVADTGGGYGVGWTDAGEWLGYTVNVTRTGTYTVQARVASGVPVGPSISSSTGSTRPGRSPSRTQVGGTRGGR
ncbi:carbohydrate-binding protein [Archangium violaceum]|nr:carbohydrate-binding protein [Archangium violaceum]